MDKFDLIVIGGGPGGYPLAIKMARKGWRVAIVERDQEFGGTCLNWGCIPTKALLACAKNYSLLKNASDFGLSCNDVSFDWAKILERKTAITIQLRQGIIKLLEKSGVKLYRGTGKLLKNRMVEINGTEPCIISGERVCLAVGSKPSVPGFIPQNRSIFWSSDDALNAAEVPEQLLVVGGGVIGMELGQVFCEFGSKVTVVEMMPEILPGLDSVTAKRLLPVFKKSGMEILTAKKVESLQEYEGRAKAVISGCERVFDKVLVAVGRKVNFAFCQDSDVNIEQENGLIKIDKNYETSENNVFAIGDAIKGPMLAHKATYDAMILAEKFCGEQVEADYSLVPSCVYTHPEIAWVGHSEDSLKAAQIEYKVGRSLFSANGKALTAGEKDGQVKTLISTDGKLLGAVIWGPEASNLINEATMMSQFAIGSNAFSKMIHPHPTLSEAFMEAVESVNGGGVHG